MQDRSANLRAFFARYITASARVRDPRIEQAFAAVKRESFAGPGPWSVYILGNNYIQTPDDDPAFLYQNMLIALDTARGIHIGEPSSHAYWLDQLALRESETVLHIGAGVGYYTSILAHLVGPKGYIHAYEIDEGFAERAKQNLREMPWVDVHARSGFADDLPKVDAIYVNAAITQPARCWLDALRPNGRLIFPLHGVGGSGGMLMITRPESGLWPARFVSKAVFVSLTGPQDEEAGRRFNATFQNGGMAMVRSFRTDKPKDDSCWFAGEGWWLSTADPDEVMDES